MSTKKLLSYVLPLVVEQGKTSIGQTYEINFENGVKVLNSRNTNYSFGSLHQIMLKGIEEVLRHKKVSNVLMLGYGAGSAVSILNTKCHWPLKIMAVELDADLIQLSKTHFGASDIDNLNLIHGDASKVITELPQASFDCIIDDVFWDDAVPTFCREAVYVSNNYNLLEKGGIYMRNVMAHGFEGQAEYEALLKETFSEVQTLKHKTYGNKIYICKK